MAYIICVLLIFYALHVYVSIKMTNENKNLKEENERLKHELLQSEIKNLRQQNETLMQQNNFSTDAVE